MQAASRMAHVRLAAIAAHLHPNASNAAASHLSRRSVPFHGLGRSAQSWSLALQSQVRVLSTAAAPPPPSSAAAASALVAPTGRHAQKHKLPLIPAPSARDAGRLVVVLDMDETLLHSSLTPFPLGADPRSVDDHMDALAERKSKQESSRMKKPEHCFTIHEDGQQQERIRSVMRPGLREFLLAISAEFEPILFTSAMSIYARPLLDLVEGPAPGEASVTVPGEAPIPAELHPVFRHRLYREATVPAQEIDYGYVKDIRLLGRDMRRTILVDNSWHACVHAPDNCIIVPDYLGSSDDQVFKPLLALLREAATHEDVRPYLRAKLRFREQLEKQGLKFKGMPKEGKDITLEEEQKQHRN